MKVAICYCKNGKQLSSDNNLYLVVIVLGLVLPCTDKLLGYLVCLLHYWILLYDHAELFIVFNK